MNVVLDPELFFYWLALSCNAKLVWLHFISHRMGLVGFINFMILNLSFFKKICFEINRLQNCAVKWQHKRDF